MITAQDIINQTNQYRVEQGLPPLTLDPTLQKAAEARAKDMAVTGNFSHDVATTSPTMQNAWGFMQQAGYRYRKAGENLATLFDDATSTMTGWKNSPTHNQNLVNPAYTQIGVGVVPVTYKGQKTSFVIQFFGTPLDVPSAAPQTSVQKPAVQKVAPAPVPNQFQPPTMLPVDTRMSQSTPQTTQKPQSGLDFSGIIRK